MSRILVSSLVLLCSSIFAATTTVPFSGPPVPIPDSSGANTPGVTASATVTAAGILGALTDVDFRFDGATPSAVAGATTVGIEHSFVNDLVITLTSPQGTTITLCNRFDSGGNNICQTLLTDGAATSIQTLVSAQAPFVGTFAPAEPLAAFNGQDPNGVWTLRVTDYFIGDTGNIRAFSIIFTTPDVFITAGGPITQPIDSPAANFAIATVQSALDPVGSLVVTATGVPTGLSITNIVNNAGSVTADIVANGTATMGANTVVLQAADSHGHTATANLTINVSAAVVPTWTSPPTATLVFAGADIAVQFSALAVDPDGGTLTYVWSFGDGGIGTGNALDHVYAADGVYIATVTVTDPDGNSVTGSVTVTISYAKAGEQSDLDADGFTDELELALGCSPYDAKSTPFGGAPAPARRPFSIDSAALSVRLDFTRSKKDSIALSGTFLTNGPMPAKATVVCSVGGVVRQFSLNSGGRGQDKTDGTKCTATVQSPGTLSAGARNVAFSFSLKRGGFAARLVDEGLTATVAGEKLVAIPVTILFNGSLYYAQVEQIYSVTRGVGQTWSR